MLQLKRSGNAEVSVSKTPKARDTTPAPTASPELSDYAVLRSKPGPWGELEYFTVYLEATMEMLKSMDISSFETRWRFVGMTVDDVTKLFKSVELPVPIRTELSDTKKWTVEDGTVTVLPSQATIVGLPVEARATIYRTLARWPDNEFHHEPELVGGKDVRDWLRRANLREEIVSTIEKTVYKRGKNLVFGDTPLVLRLAQTDEERLVIRKALSRTPALAVKLVIHTDTDINKLVEYWSGKRRTRDIAPFLESVVLNPRVDRLDLIHILPPTIRKILYTYPGQSFSRTGYLPDCHWSSLNFRNYETLDRLADPMYATSYVLENYTRISGGAYRYGDVLFLMDGKSGNAIHSCVYLADDIVFTKNGRSPMQPWILSKLDDVVSYYGMYYDTQVDCYRRKDEE